MLVLAKNRRDFIGQVRSSSQRVASLIGGLSDKMNLGRSKTKAKNRRAGSGLKFHNFVANCSAVGHTNGAASQETPNETTHCLKEEHGTKQITVSHWRKSTNSSSDSNLGSSTNLSPTANAQFNLSASCLANSSTSGSPGNPALSSGQANSSPASTLTKGSSSPSRTTTRSDQSPFAEPAKSNKTSKAKFSLLSESNPLISRSDFTLPHQPPSEANRNFLIQNLITDNNSWQYCNGKQKHLNLKQLNAKGSHSSSSPTSLTFKTHKPGNSGRLSGQFGPSGQLNSGQLNSNQLNSGQVNSGQSTGGHLVDGLFGSQLNTSQLANQLSGQLNRLGKFNSGQFNELNSLSSLNLQQSLDQINQLNLILNDNNLLKANESILSNLLKEIGDARSSGGRNLLDNRNSSFGNGNRTVFTPDNGGSNQTNRNSNSLNNPSSNLCNSLNNSLISNQHSADKQAVKISRRKPVFVRRLIKVEADDSNEQERTGSEQPLDLSLKKRKLSANSGRSGEASGSKDHPVDLDKELEKNLDSLFTNSLIGKQSTNECS